MAKKAKKKASKKKKTTAKKRKTKKSEELDAGEFPTEGIESLETVAVELEKAARNPVTPPAIKLFTNMFIQTLRRAEVDLDQDSRMEFRRLARSYLSLATEQSGREPVVGCPGCGKRLAVSVVLDGEEA